MSSTVSELRWIPFVGTASEEMTGDMVSAILAGSEYDTFEQYIDGRVDSLRSDPEAANSFVSGRGGEHLPATTRNAIGHKLLMRYGDDCLKKKRYDEAQERYKEALKAKLGKDVQVPLSPLHGGVRSDLYITMNPMDLIRVMDCCNSIAHCLIKTRNWEEVSDHIVNFNSTEDKSSFLPGKALEWLEEGNVQVRNIALAQKIPCFDWFACDLRDREYYISRLTNLSRAGDVFLELGNTGSAVHRRWTASTIVNNPDPQYDRNGMDKIVPRETITSVTQLRHPEPRLVPKLGVSDGALQVRGSWQKLDVPKSGIIPARHGFSSFVWSGRLYIAGGEKDVDSPGYRDFWYIDLRDPSLGWRTLPRYPVPEAETGSFYGFSMVLHEHRAYLFTGRPTLDFFDLKTKKWGQLRTTYKRDQEGKWPYPNKVITNYAMSVSNDKIYVFGGWHPRSSIGCNLLMVLDLSSPNLEWERLSGTAGPLKADFNSPGPRRHPSGWIDKAEERFYIMYGEADRQAAMLGGEPHGAMNGQAYDDMWSWSIREKKWRRERIAGNPPCPRSEMSCSYNAVLNKTIVFGGYNPTLPTFYSDKNETFIFSYYADTFVFEPSASPAKRSKWRQVLTRGFPTYRAQSLLVSDPTTGKIFLFGGYTNCEYISSRQLASRSFNDLWQLKVDVPGGSFEGVDLEEESRTAKAGPWQRCFACGNVGPWKKCAGTCKGKAFFCDLDCLRNGWKDHKKMHKCANST